MNRRTLLAAPALLALPARAQSTYPDRPITVVVGFLPGGSVDIGTRLLVDRMAPRIAPNARMIVENRPAPGGRSARVWRGKIPTGISSPSPPPPATAPTPPPCPIRCDTMR